MSAVDRVYVEDDPYTMANFRPGTTGLPMVVWLSEQAGAQHDVRIKVCRVHGNRMQPDHTASVAVRPQPHPVVAGTLSPADLQAVVQWIALNEASIVDYWDGLIDTAELTHRLRPLNPPIAP
jgi:hypothetical protein